MRTCSTCIIFDTWPLSKKRLEVQFRIEAGKNLIISEEEQWLGMNLYSMFDGKGMKTHGRSVIGTQPVKPLLDLYFVLLQC